MASNNRHVLARYASLFSSGCRRLCRSILPFRPESLFYFLRFMVANGNRTPPVVTFWETSVSLSPSPLRAVHTDYVRVPSVPCRPAFPVGTRAPGQAVRCWRGARSWGWDRAPFLVARPRTLPPPLWSPRGGATRGAGWAEREQAE